MVLVLQWGPFWKDARGPAASMGLRCPLSLLSDAPWVDPKEQFDMSQMASLPLAPPPRHYIHPSSFQIGRPFRGSVALDRALPPLVRVSPQVMAEAVSS